MGFLNALHLKYTATQLENSTITINMIPKLPQYNSQLSMMLNN